MKKEYEVVAEICNACAGSERPQTFIEEAELENTDDYVRMKHGRDWELVKKEILPSGDIQYTLDKGSITYKYTFTE
ncbi:MAG TPA: hypothetical protein IAA05_01470 [Candidatus Blautia excrementipullorum]|nr:hypothetical protein [Candidatus Blautia excrementipullorum]